MAGGGDEWHWAREGLLHVLTKLLCLCSHGGDRLQARMLGHLGSMRCPELMLQKVGFLGGGE